MALLNPVTRPPSIRESADFEVSSQAIVSNTQIGPEHSDQLSDMYAYGTVHSYKHGQLVYNTGNDGMFILTTHIFAPTWQENSWSRRRF